MFFHTCMLTFFFTGTKILYIIIYLPQNILTSDYTILVIDNTCNNINKIIDVPGYQ